MDRVWVRSWRGRSVKLLLLIPVAALAACFSSNVQEGLACSEAGDCPIGQDCFEGTCSGGAPLDSGSGGDDAAVNDAAPEPDAEPRCAAGLVPCGEECLAECVTEFTAEGEATYQPEEGCTYLRMVAWGAGGGHGRNNVRGAGGGYALAERVVSSADSFTVVVGAPGTSTNAQAGGPGGLPGGGNGGGSNSEGGGGGGGYSGVFLGTIEVANAVLIAGGGGGSGGGNGNPSNTQAGAGGGLAGQDGPVVGSGGTQTTGFEPLQGGVGGTPGGGDGGGGGGGGYFGGVGGGVANSDAPGGAGGSGYVGDAPVSDLQTGNRGTPGNATSPLRGDAGNPLTAGKVIVSCIPKPTP
jgi:hypothetical protein